MDGWGAGDRAGISDPALAVFVSNGTGHHPFPTWLHFQARALVPTVCAGVGLSNVIF